MENQPYIKQTKYFDEFVRLFGLERTLEALKTKRGYDTLHRNYRYNTDENVRQKNINRAYNYFIRKKNEINSNILNKKLINLNII